MSMLNLYHTDVLAEKMSLVIMVIIMDISLLNKCNAMGRTVAFYLFFFLFPIIIL